MTQPLDIASICALYMTKGAVAVLPQRIDFKDYAAQDRVLEGSLPLSQFKRLSDIILNPNGLVRYKLVFGQDGRRRVVIASHIEVTLSIACQRCNEPANFNLNLSSSLCPVTDDLAAKALPKSYEPFLIAGDELQPIDIIEEELLLGVPMVARHDAEACVADLAEYLK